LPRSVWPPAPATRPCWPATPLGKIPFIRLADGRSLCESQVICDYLEAAYPEPALLPADKLAAAKVRELIAFMELYIELVGRELYGQAYFGGSLDEAAQARVKKQLERNLAGLRRLARFAPYAAGEQFTLADCAAYAACPRWPGPRRRCTARTWWPRRHRLEGHLKAIGERPSVQRVNADRKRDAEATAASR
jgi:glutathione S-transferase